MASNFGILSQVNYSMQPGRAVRIKSDGSAEGTVEYECDRAKVAFLPPLYSPHPDDSSLVAHDIVVNYNGSNLVRAVYSYFGLSAFYNNEKTTIEFDSACDTVPIQTHPDFQSFAGTPESPANGALWVDVETGEISTDPEKAEFRGWVSGEFRGVESYIVARPIVRKTYFRKSAPALDTTGKIIRRISGVPSIPGITNWLCLGASYREIGGHFQISEEYKGSPAPGWNSKIYR